MSRATRCVPPAPGKMPELDLGEAEARLVARDAQVARERELEAAAEGEAFDRGDHRPRDRPERVERAAEGGADARRGAGLGELRDVGAGGERLLVAGDDDRLHAGVGGERGRVGGDLVEQRGGQRVQRRAVEPQQRDAVAPFEMDESVGHATWRSRRSRGHACDRAVLLPPSVGGAAGPRRAAP